MIITTGDIDRKYEIIDVCWCIKEIDDEKNYSWTKDCDASIKKAFNKLKSLAFNLGADAIINLKIESNLNANVTECGVVLVYGTAVKFIS